MPAAPFLTRALDALMAALNTIGPADATWHTTPVVAEGTPANAPDNPTQPQIYLQFVRSYPNNQDVIPARHAWRAEFVVWIITKTVRLMFDAHADVLLAIYNEETTIAAALAAQFAWPDDFSYRDEMSVAGMAVGSQRLLIDYDTDHLSP